MVRWVDCGKLEVGASRQSPTFRDGTVGMILAIVVIKKSDGLKIPLTIGLWNLKSRLTNFGFWDACSSWWKTICMCNLWLHSSARGKFFLLSMFSSCVQIRGKYLPDSSFSTSSTAIAQSSPDVLPAPQHGGDPTT